MSDHHVKIHNREGGGYTVEVGGHPIHNSVSSLTLAIDAGSLKPVLTLRLSMVSADVDTQAVVRLDEDTTEALTAMGWTPPEDGD